MCNQRINYVVFTLSGGFTHGILFHICRCQRCCLPSLLFQWWLHADCTGYPRVGQSLPLMQCICVETNLNANANVNGNVGININIRNNIINCRKIMHQYITFQLEGDWQCGCHGGALLGSYWIDININILEHIKVKCAELGVDVPKEILLWTDNTCRENKNQWVMDLLFLFGSIC